MISDVFPLFIEVGCLKNKLNKIRYELEWKIPTKHINMAYINCKQISY